MNVNTDLVSTAVATTDEVQLRHADGTEHYVPVGELARQFYTAFLKVTATVDGAGTAFASVLLNVVWSNFPSAWAVLSNSNLKIVLKPASHAVVLPSSYSQRLLTGPVSAAGEGAHFYVDRNGPSTGVEMELFGASASTVNGSMVQVQVPKEWVVPG